MCSILRYRLNVLLPPLPEVRFPLFLEILNPSEKVMERSGLRFEHFFVWKWSKIAKQKKIVLLADFVCQNLVETTLPDELETSGQRVYRYVWHISRRF